MIVKYMNVFCRILWDLTMWRDLERYKTWQNIFSTWETTVWLCRGRSLLTLLPFGSTCLNLIKLKQNIRNAIKTVSQRVDSEPQKRMLLLVWKAQNGISWPKEYLLKKKVDIVVICHTNSNYFYYYLEPLQQERALHSGLTVIGCVKHFL